MRHQLNLIQRIHRNQKGFGSAKKAKSNGTIESNNDNTQQEDDQCKTST